jgi:hypothetical protein
MEDRQMADPLPVGFLAGSNHTGSTLLALLMDMHPQIASVGETSLSRGYAIGAGHCSCGEWIRECAFWTGIFQAVTEQGVELNAFNWSNDYRYRNIVMHRMLSRLSHNRYVRRAQLAASDMLPGHRSRIERVNRANVLFTRAVLEGTGARVFFDTSKYAARFHHLLRIPDLDVKVIRLVRDARGFAGSEKKRGHGAEYAANVWVRQQEVITDIIRGLPSERVLLVRYEDICADPRHWLRKLHVFLGVDPMDTPLTVRPRSHHVLGNPIRKSETVTVRAPEDWRERLSEAEVSAVMRIAGAANTRFGYV